MFILQEEDENNTWMTIVDNTDKVLKLHDFPNQSVGRLFFKLGGVDCNGAAYVTFKSSIITAAHIFWDVEGM